MNVQIGSAPDSWGVWFPEDDKQVPFDRFLDEIAEAGYEYTELGPYGYLPTDVGKLKDELQKRNLKVSGTFVMAHLEDPTCAAEIERQLHGAAKLVVGLHSPGEGRIVGDNHQSHPHLGIKLHKQISHHPGGFLVE